MTAGIVGEVTEPLRVKTRHEGGSVSPAGLTDLVWTSCSCLNTASPSDNYFWHGRMLCLKETV